MGEIWEKYERNMREIWEKYGRNMGEIWEKPSHCLAHHPCRALRDDPVPAIKYLK